MCLPYVSVRISGDACVCMCAPDSVAHCSSSRPHLIYRTRGESSHTRLLSTAGPRSQCLAAAAAVDVADVVAVDVAERLRAPRRLRENIHHHPMTTILLIGMRGGRRGQGEDRTGRATSVRPSVVLLSNMRVLGVAIHPRWILTTRTHYGEHADPTHPTLTDTHSLA
eukprot:GHVU01206197.1.p1 GENE.GHVU01206197.1~~GHVU01206197.1.p1  ORF type:complete len:167 (+),score=6.25 GHVU01206197.1:209-709(+)